MKKTQWPKERTRNERLDKRAAKLRAKQKRAEWKLYHSPPDLRGQLLHDGLREKQDMPYGGYLLSKHWRIARKKALELAGAKCSVCGSCYRLNVHHVTYDNLWHEYANDVVVLCEACHSMLHGQYIHPA